MAPELAAGLDRVWRRLAAAVADRASPLRTPVVATVADRGADGQIMVLRDVDRSASTLTFFTDVRAAKVTAIAAVPDVAILAYDPGERLQLRLRGVASILSRGDAADAAWSAIGDEGRRSYRTVAPPGTPAESSDAAAQLGAGDGRANFALLTVTVDAVEWLDLAGPVHRRARYHREAGDWHATWCVP